jgi:hypothetical protein
VAAHIFVKLMDESSMALPEAAATQRSIDFSLRPVLIEYSMSAQGLECSIDLGAVRPRISRILKYMDLLLSQRE